jgi:hypothetical protein
MDILNCRARVHHEARTAQTGTPSTCQGSSTAWNCQNNGAVKITDARDPIGGARTCVLTLPGQKGEAKGLTLISLVRLGRLASVPSENCLTHGINEPVALLRPLFAAASVKRGKE